MIRSPALAGFVRRETALLVVLCVIATGSFFLTRAFAAANRRMYRSDAAHWHDVGRQRLGSGDHRGAIEAFRTASAMERDNVQYRLALADAEVAAGQQDAARDGLLRVRATAPENVEVNRRLARLEAPQGHVEAAARYYGQAILSLWDPSRIDERRALRTELIEVLLDNHQPGRALSEVLKLSGEIPDDTRSHVETGRLFLRSGAPGRALAQFESALALEPSSPAALAGGGEAAFETGDYERAHRYLQRAPREGRVPDLLALTDLIVTTDPLLPRLSRGERAHRLADLTTRMIARLSSCAAGEADLAQLTELEGSLHERRSAPTDEVGADLATLAAIARRAQTGCGPATDLDRAILLTARQHGLEAR